MGKNYSKLRDDEELKGKIGFGRNTIIDLLSLAFDKNDLFDNMAQIKEILCYLCSSTIGEDLLRTVLDWDIPRNWKFIQKAQAENDSGSTSRRARVARTSFPPAKFEEIMLYAKR